jgi:methylenetetrahydrofolate reductase (NADPH)
MRIADRLASGPPCFSFEFFPPKSDEGYASLQATLRDLAELKPGFVSVTYGAGGSTQRKTIDVVSSIKKETGIEAMAHLTCVAHDRPAMREVLGRLADAGVENVLAIRGDLPSGVSAPPTGGFQHASELMAYVRSEKLPFCLGGACYPEGHLESDTRDSDLKFTRHKVESGAEFLITQLFFDNAFYFHFVERARAAGVRCPIVPGIMPITNVEQIERMTRMCGATVPMKLRLALERQKDAESVLQLGVAHAAMQCAELLRHGVPGIHFYTLNRSRASRMIVAALEANA